MTLTELAVRRLIPAPSQWPEYYSWADDAFAINDDSWNGAGRLDAWSSILPYGKMINSTYLLAYALRDEYIPQWHARGDYLAVARAIDSKYHGPFYTRFLNRDSGEAAAETGRVAARDRTNFHCPVFHANGPSDDPANRAAVMVHEAWHHWQYKYDWDGSHLTGGAIAPGTDGDWYYFHGSGLFDFGTLWFADENSSPLKFHSPYQVGIEYNADLAEFPFSWVPVVVRDQARFYGNSRLATQCRNRVFYRIGTPRPF
ncbi:hypothetical protein J7I98_26810 [Streptomyces sp. ISL-98]|uniref:hypothetical protein n=1 Tax=Streptomyces sp. ISL-98 TaxID=2819192 RepID=UPI001BED26B0|nr:hypothetical protein [Streptomyces sp. ISL-98]MBT2509426.1 hypothetical protein [Streptomyces sp. ISL-98]